MSCQSVLWVTAFKDIGRDKWHLSPRTFDYYLARFKRLIEPLGDNLVCFVDDPHAEIIKSSTGFTRIYPFNTEDTFMNKYTTKQQEIINSDEYKKLLPNFLWPGFIHAEYGTLNYSKVCFVRRASEIFENYTHYAWIDFGYAIDQCNTPPHGIVSLNPDKIMISSFRRFHVNENRNHVLGRGWCTTLDGSTLQNWTDPQVMLQNFYPGIHGNLWICPKHHIKWFEKEFERSIQVHHDQGIANHDEPLWLPIINSFPNKFEIFQKTNKLTPWWFGKDKILWVTCFIDYGMRRSKQDYLEMFERIKDSFENIICFTDHDDIPVQCHPFNLDDTFIPGYIERQREIINDPEFRKIIPETFKYNPEFNYPEYGLLNASKTCLLRRASELYPDFTHYAWIDFGYAKTPPEAPPKNFTIDRLVDSTKILMSSHKDFGLGTDGETYIGPYDIRGSLMKGTTGITYELILLDLLTFYKEICL